MALEVDQPLQPVALREAIDDTFAMLPERRARSFVTPMYSVPSTRFVMM
jgi:hypothetical protein